jgi:hypothetical protein
LLYDSCIFRLEPAKIPKEFRVILASRFEFKIGWHEEQAKTSS